MRDEICHVLRHCHRPTDLAKLMDDAADEIERLRPMAESYVKMLELAFELSDDDGGLYHDWQDALKALEQR